MNLVQDDQLIFRRLAEAMPQIVWTADPDGGLVSNAAVVQNMVDALWNYARIDQFVMARQLCDCSEILEKVLTRLDPLIEEKKAKVTADKLPVINANLSQLEYMFQQLIENAVKYSGPKQPTIHCSAKERADEWIISVKDNGLGFDMMDVNHIFKIFQRLRKDVPGTGMGLAVCKRIAEAHGGNIWANSEPGNGSTFYFTISK